VREQTPPRGAQAALRAVRLLKLFTAEQPDLQLAEISKRAGLNKTTAHRLLQALASEELLDRDPATGAYRLGPAVLALGAQAMASNGLRMRARPLLKRLAEETGETATLEVRVDDAMLILDEVTGGRFLGAGGNVGTRWPLHASSTGKAVLAFDAESRPWMPSRLDAFTSRTITSRQQLDAALDAIRRRGFAETVDELEDGFTGVATVVRGRDEDILAAISICGPTQRLPADRREKLGLVLCQAAGELRSGIQERVS